MVTTRYIPLLTEPITSPDQLRQALLQRIPESERELFFSPPHPQDLTSEQTGLSSTSLQAAAARIHQAIDKQEKVVIFGDYDCDGITATAVLWETLRDSGLTAQPFLPHREKHGYGLSIIALQEIFKQKKPDLLITVDNGIVAHEAFRWLKEQGVSTILTDHHQPHGDTPPADIIVHSTKLAGVTVAWSLAYQLNPTAALKHLDLTVLGTLADQVPLLGANRSFAVHGLQALRTTQRPSLLALSELAGIDLNQATPETVHYHLAPRINALGRVGDPLQALRALVSRNPSRTQELMAEMEQANQQRQFLTKQSWDEVVVQIELQEVAPIMVIEGKFHEGIIGLLASKVVDVTGKPAIVLSLGDKIAKASCRSVKGINITDFLHGLDVPFLSLGGHELAAGFSVALENVAQLKHEINIKSSNLLPINEQIIDRSIISTLDWLLLNSQTISIIQEFSPFGNSNEEPTFALSFDILENIKAVGKSQTHWQLYFRNEAGQSVQAIYFNGKQKWPSEEVAKNTQFAIVRLAPSTYAKKQLEIIVTDLVSSLAT